MNRKHDTQQHTPTDRYRLEGPRWWWTPAVAGAVATTALAAILTTAAPGSAIPTDVDRYAGPAPAAEPPDIPDGWRQCFMWQSHWNAALDGAQPLCPEEPRR
jgi:hypothetical protein